MNGSQEDYFSVIGYDVSPHCMCTLRSLSLVGSDRPPHTVALILLCFGIYVPYWNSRWVTANLLSNEGTNPMTRLGFSEHGTVQGNSVAFRLSFLHLNVLSDVALAARFCAVDSWRTGCTCAALRCQLSLHQPSVLHLAELHSLTSGGRCKYMQTTCHHWRAERTHGPREISIKRPQTIIPTPNATEPVYIWHNDFFLYPRPIACTKSSQKSLEYFTSCFSLGYMVDLLYVPYAASKVRWSDVTGVAVAHCWPPSITWTITLFQSAVRLSLNSLSQPSDSPVLLY